ncbi:uncharacterized protein LOC130826895 [Amaranthus tricolor]|uniref:uncharacterized protein LOC130826895 n=1 Tax=Amaranthus tricolor TaxID=29722 RepID=UPI0025838842|nr:uncharacterized protein LOC130826895 [Amaranthus tricolor]XP_057548507.1 uncharacterized protein LOC130826895 [Amaranthus tricolor]XP_057548508.1 uncharacterized protein LOC130826895 [Amaranthus tricolor]XP_057548509.1 uncharacterized protein LOC130826895 [Amaranthus tricolor]XP_057548510.1 uncharacterized protein LOC130826895 [Amaranthus tricolor]XP_057548511.1 uncharacterized protein LOC130826895 [Amaranthus tricolor]
MDLDSQTMSQVSSPYNLLGDLANDHVDLLVACGLCGGALSLEDEVNRGLQSVSICDDCKFLLLEDFGTPAHNSVRRRLARRRSINGSSDSIENFSQQFSQIINQARHIESEHEEVRGDTDSNVMVMQPTSSRTTPSGSRRWRRIFSDTESDGFNSDSFYGESESNVSVGAYRIHHGDSDAISFSSYENDSAASVDGNSYLDTDMLVQFIERSDFGSDSDIDPMHAGAINWNFDEHGLEGGESGEANVEENTVSPQEFGARINSIFGSDNFGEHSITEFSEFEGMIRRRINEIRDLQIPNIQMFGEAPYSANPEDYLDAREFEELMENIAENSNSRRGAPPAALSFIQNLRLIVISEEQHKSDGLVCAICKDLLMVGTEVNQLPCFHLYHPSCILPWLRARNSCPLCRYELPTDDKDYDLGKRDTNLNRGMIISEIQPQEEDRGDISSVNTDMSVDVVEDFSSTSGDIGPATNLSHTNNRRMGGWLFLAAGPIVSLVGIVLVLCLGNANREGGRRGLDLDNWRSLPIQTSSLCPHNQQEKKWWWWGW